MIVAIIKAYWNSWEWYNSGPESIYRKEHINHLASDLSATKTGKSYTLKSP